MTPPPNRYKCNLCSHIWNHLLSQPPHRCPECRRNKIHKLDYSNWPRSREEIESRIDNILGERQPLSSANEHKELPQKCEKAMGCFECKYWNEVKNKCNAGVPAGLVVIPCPKFESKSDDKTCEPVCMKCGLPPKLCICNDIDNDIRSMPITFPFSCRQACKYFKTYRCNSCIKNPRMSDNFAPMDTSDISTTYTANYDWTECDCDNVNEITCGCGATMCVHFYQQRIYHWRGKHWISECILNQLAKEANEHDRKEK